MSAIKRRALYAILCLLLCCEAAAPALAGAAASAALPTLEVSGPFPAALAGQALLRARALLEEGKPDEAEKIYAMLRGSPQTELRIEAAFQSAQLRLMQGRFRQAIGLYLEILRQRPDLPRVRLELARAYFLDKNYEDAAFQFELVKGGDLPPSVLERVDAFLDAIRRQKNWTLDFALSPVSDSNINQSSGGREECIDTVFGTLCRPLEEKASGLGLSANATADYFWRFHQDWGLRGTVGLGGLAYEQKEYNDYYLYAALGPRYLWESGEASLQPTFRKRWIANKEYSEEYGLRLDSRWIYNSLILNAGATLAVSDYADPYVHDALHGMSWSVRLQPRYILNDRTFIQAGLEFLRDDANVRAYASDNRRYALGAYRVLPYGLSMFVEGSLTDTAYQAPQWYVTKNNRIEETVRKDKTWALFTSLSSNALERFGVTPLLQYTYQKRDSNIWTREYERHRLTFLFNVRF